MNTIVFFLLVASTIDTAVARQNQISVKLFGQPCWLKGPISEKQLQGIHAITPENVFPLDSEKKVRKSLKILKENSKLPKAMEHYKKLLSKYLQAHEAFFRSANLAASEKKSEVFLDGIKNYLERNHKALKHRARGFNQKMKRKQRRAYFYELLEIYQESITPSPEEDFHRGLSQLKVRYNCEFDRNHDAGLQDEGESDSHSH